MQLSALYIHPIKSCAPLACTKVEARPRGPAGDRRWMLVDRDGRFVTGRRLPALVLLRAEPVPGGLVLAWQDRVHRVLAPRGEHGRMRVRVWDSEVDAARADPATCAWIRRCLGAELELVHMDAEARRWVDPARAGPGRPLSFADADPWLLVSAASLQHLNRHIRPAVPVEAFRPNLVISGAPAWAEDGWMRLRIGEVVFRKTKPCTRCVFTTVEPQSGRRREDGEPLRTLRALRRSAEGLLFGIDLVAENRGTLAVGDPVEVLAAEDRGEASCARSGAPGLEAATIGPR